jgi:hypothetical protein
MDLVNKQGYRLPFGVPQKGYPWGSNSFVLTNAMSSRSRTTSARTAST